MLGRIADEVVTLRPLDAGDRAELRRRMEVAARNGIGTLLMVIWAAGLGAFLRGFQLVVPIGLLGVMAVILGRSIVDFVWLVRDRRCATAIVLTSPRGKTERLMPSGRAWGRRE